MEAADAANRPCSVKHGELMAELGASLARKQQAPTDESLNLTRSYFCT